MPKSALQWKLLTYIHMIVLLLLLLGLKQVLRGTLINSSLIIYKLRGEKLIVEHHMSLHFPDTYISNHMYQNQSDTNITLSLPSLSPSAGWPASIRSDLPSACAGCHGSSQQTFLFTIIRGDGRVGGIWWHGMRGQWPLFLPLYSLSS